MHYTVHKIVGIIYCKYLVRMDNMAKLLTDYFPIWKFYDAPLTVTTALITSNSTHVHT
jgi:hypothetical protein